MEAGADSMTDPMLIGYNKKADVCFTQAFRFRDMLEKRFPNSVYLKPPVK